MKELKRRLERLLIQEKELESLHVGNELKFTYWGGHSLGYIKGHMLEKAIRIGLNKKEALEKYGKNRYTVNPNAKVIKAITHK